MIANPTVARVAENTAAHVNAQIDRQTRERLAWYATASPSEIDRRLEELDREWNIERTLEANAAAFALTGLTLGATISRKWFLFPAIVAGFLLQHAVEGWCPPVPVLRRLGFRTPREIEEERNALKALRGDYANASEGDAEGALSAARR